jgi:exodeoxyribonuclease VIII
MHEIQNGVHDIPNDIYHGSAGLSRSGLMEFKKSPYHYWHRYLNQERKPSFTTPAMKLGELVHALVLEPMYFDDRYMLKPILFDVPKCGLLKDLGREEFDRQKAERERVQEINEHTMQNFITQSEGREVISNEVYAEAKHYADAVLNDGVAKALFTGVQVEKSIYFTHKGTGLQCKVRPDAWIGGVVTDLKTCKDASFDAFQRAAVGAGYFIQAAMIKQALESIGIEMQKFIFYCVEKSEAAPCTYYELDMDTLERAENEYNSLMHGIAYCMDNNRWGAYQPQVLTYPSWAKI